MALGYNLNIFANGAAGLWTRRVCPLDFVFEKRFY